MAELSRYLLPSDVVLDMGCGNGWATIRLASRCHRITGVDYSDEMISRARAEHSQVKNCDWRVGDVLSLNESATYDAVVTVRCLINIVQRNLQWRAITNLQRAIKPGGRLLMVEGIQDGRRELNRIRQRVGLTPMPSVQHNLDFDVDSTRQFLKSLFISVHFQANGIYDLVTRVLYPLMIRPAAPAYDSPYHVAACAIAQQVSHCEQLSRWGMFMCVK